MLFQLPASRQFGSSPLVNASAFLRTDPFNYRGSSVAAGEKPSRRRPRETRTVDATTTVTANPTPNSVVMYFAQPTGAVSGSNRLSINVLWKACRRTQALRLPERVL